MAIQAHKTILWFVVAIALAFGAMIAPANAYGPSVAGAPASAEAARHAQLGEGATGDRHVHDEGEPDERGPGHLHSDGPAEHSHEKLGVMARVSTVLAPQGDCWVSAAIASLHLHGRRRLDRPPRRSAAF